MISNSHQDSSDEEGEIPLDGIDSVDESAILPKVQDFSNSEFHKELVDQMEAPNLKKKPVEDQSDDSAPDVSDSDSSFREKATKNREEEIYDEEDSQFIKNQDSASEELVISDEEPDLIEEAADNPQPIVNQNKQEPVRNLKLKPEQLELFRNSIGLNSIIYLPTGTGKTLVSILAMQYYLNLYGDSKKILFLANTVQLVKQQAQAIRKYLPIVAQNSAVKALVAEKIKYPYNFKLEPDNAHDKVVCLHGERSDQVGMTQKKRIELNLMDKRQLVEKINKGWVVVMIAQMFLNCLRRGYVKLSDFSLIVLDECHHCDENHPFSSIMKEFYFLEKKKREQMKSNELKFQSETLPYIMGLSASPVRTIPRPEKLKEEIKKLTVSLDADYIYYSRPARQQHQRQIQKEKVRPIRVTTEGTNQEFVPDLLRFFQSIQNHHDPVSESHSKLEDRFPQLYELANQINACVKNIADLHSNTKTMVDELKKSLLLKGVEVWLELGTFAFYLVMEDLVEEFKKIKTKKDPELKAKLDLILTQHLQVFRDRYSKCCQENFSVKLNELIRTIIDEQSKGEKKILIFVHERRTVKYLQKVLQEYKDGIKDPDLQSKLSCKGVTGVSVKRMAAEKLDNEKITVNITDIQQQLKLAKQKHRQFLKNLEDESTPGESYTTSLQRQQRKMDAARICSQLLEPQQRYSTQITKIKEFRMRVYPILIATSVVEEGFDIPHCNLVISYNPPMSLQSFVQIKGRARDKNSSYIILCNEEEYDKIKEQVEMYLETVELAHQIAIENLSIRDGKPSPKPSFEPDPDFRMTRIKSGSVINTNYSVELVKSYINCLRPAGASNNKTKIFPFYCNLPETGYVCHIMFPSGCPIQSSTGWLCRSKDNALRAAAYKAAVQLRKLKHLKEDLKPKDLRDLQDQGDTEMYKDLQMTKTDPEYKLIFQEYVRIEIDEHNNKREKLHFQYLKNSFFDFPTINPSFKKYIEEVAAAQDPSIKFPYQVYRIKVSNNNKVIGTVPNLGILTCFEQQHVSSIFSNFRHQVKERSGEWYELTLVEEKLMLSLTEYETLREVHTFLIASIYNEELQYLKGEPGAQQLIVPAWRNKLNNRKDIGMSIDRSRKYFPLFILLKKEATNDSPNKKVEKYGLDKEMTQLMLKHKDLLLKVYNYHNKNQSMKTGSFSRNNQLPKFQEDLSEQLILFDKSQDELLKKGYLVQSLTKDFMLHKCIVKSAQRPTEELLLSCSRVGKNKNQISYQRQKEVLQKTFKHANSPYDKMVKIQLLRKQLKRMRTCFTSQQDLIHKQPDEQSQMHYLSEFVTYPLSIDTLFLIYISRDFILPRVEDYIRAYYFKNNFLKVVESTAMKKVEKVQPYTYKGEQHKVLLKYNQIIQVLEQERISSLKRLAKQFVQGHSDSYKYPCESPIQYIMKNDLKPPHPSSILHHKKGSLMDCYYSSNIDITEILKTLTSRIYRSDKAENYESLEFIGDCVLKLLATIQIFLELSTEQEGTLHLERAKVICNSNLHLHSVKHKLFNFILTKPPVEPVAPFKIAYEESLVQESYYKDTDFKMIDSASKQRGFCYVPSKVHADVIEALIGAYFLRNFKIEESQFFLFGLGILKKPTLELVRHDTQNVSNTQTTPQFLQAEKRLGHIFRDKNLLAQCFTHKTFEQIFKKVTANQVRQIRRQAQNLDNSMNGYVNLISQDLMAKHLLYYERLEFLGDSVLDLVAVEYIYQKDKRSLDEGEFTNMKQICVNNRTLGLVALYWGFDEFLLIESQENINFFDRIKKKFINYYSNVGECYSSDAAPLKILGDLFEAYVGAVFLDSGLNYEYTRTLTRRLLEPFMAHFTSEEMLGKNLHKKYMDHLKENNFIGVRVVKDYSVPPVNGYYQYKLVDKTNTQISRCRAETEKRAWDELLEQYVRGDQEKDIWVEDSTNTDSN